MLLLLACVGNVTRLPVVPLISLHVLFLAMISLLAALSGCSIQVSLACGVHSHLILTCEKLLSVCSHTDTLGKMTFGLTGKH